MKWYNIFSLIVVYFPKATALNGTTYVYTYAMAMQCKEHLSQRGYSYDQFYQIDADDARNTKSRSDLMLEMHVAIQAVNNGHILLSPVPYPTINDSVYEIVVGGGGNRFTELRRNLKRNAKASKATIGILSAVELRGFFIRISQGGIIEFGEEGADLPILKYVDLDPLDIKYFSFAAWSGIEAKFLYDCPAAGDTANQTLPDSKAVEKKLSNSDRLKKEMLQDRPPHMPPGPSVEVNLGVIITGISYDAFEAKLTTRMTLLTVWTDENLAWNPDKFNNITSLRYRQGEIWRPMFHVFNSDSANALETTGHEVITMIFKGEAVFHFKATVDTWCYSETPGFSRWPRDKYACTIVVEPWEAHEKISLEIIDDTEPIIMNVKKYSPVILLSKDVDEVIENEWEVLKLSQSLVSSLKWNGIYPSNNNETHQSDRLVINIEIQRRASTYNIVFYTPLLVLIGFLLMSFWSEPLQMSRVWFYAGLCIVICAGLCYIDYLMPCHTVPSILVLYIVVLGGILIALLLHVLLMTQLAEKLCKTMFMKNVLSTKYFRKVFCLPALMVCRNYNTINEGFLSQEEDSSPPPTGNGNIEEMEEDHTKYCERKEFVEVIDKTLFAVYSLVFAVLLGLHY